MPIKKSELYSSIWKSCDELRGGMDASQYKDYVLVLLFVKYVSDKYAGKKNPLIEVPQGGGFADMIALKGQKDIGDGMNKIIARLAEANDLKGVIDVADFNDADKLGKGKEMQDRLSNLVAIFEDPSLDFSKNRAEGDDLLGDAYEYLMRHFATESGKSKGQFYTPAEVSIVMAKVIGIVKNSQSSKTLYDPTCGSGSLLLKASDESQNTVSIYGQEMDNATSALARMNMILHDNPTAVIWQDNTLSTPHFKNPDGGLKTFDYVVANFPFSTKAWSNGFNPAQDLYGRFEDGIPPQKNGDYAFLLHILRSLKNTGKGAVILPHGVLFRGGAEGQIRRNLIRKGYIKGIIGLPANLFYGTSIPACILVLDKENAAGRSGIFMLNASQGFIKDGNKNRLRHQDIHRIVDVFTRQLESPKYARMVSLAEVEANDYNLNIPRYIDNSAEEDLQDIAAHLLGGIPERDIEGLNAYWQVFPSLRSELFAPLRPGYLEMKVGPAQVKTAIFAHPEFKTYHARTLALFETWKTTQRPLLAGIGPDTHPKTLIAALAEDLLAAFDVRAQGLAPLLVDQYDMYQHLMTYWTETMQDDVYLVGSEGWLQAGKLRKMAEDEFKKTKEKPDLVVGKIKLKADLIPPALVVARYFAPEQYAIEALKAEAEGFAAQVDELVEEHSGEEGLLAEVSEDGKISKSSVTKRLAQIKHEREAADERAILEKYLDLSEKEAEAGRKAKEAQQALDGKVVEKYGALTQPEIIVLVVDDKWLAALAASVQGELDRISQTLTGRIRELAERYEMALPQQTQTVDELSDKVDVHLKKMGFVWN
jgi:type I restriction enzyme M protein